MNPFDAIDAAVRKELDRQGWKIAPLGTGWWQAIRTGFDPVIARTLRDLLSDVVDAAKEEQRKRRHALRALLEHEAA